MVLQESLLECQLRRNEQNIDFTSIDTVVFRTALPSIIVAMRPPAGFTDTTLRDMYNGHQSHKRHTHIPYIAWALVRLPPQEHDGRGVMYVVSLVVDADGRRRNTASP